ncbi:hypothetical protein AAFN47_06235 [Hoeflea sp. CAU 1731]
MAAGAGQATVSEFFKGDLENVRPNALRILFPALTLNCFPGFGLPLCFHIPSSIDFCRASPPVCFNYIVQRIENFIEQYITGPVARMGEIVERRGGYGAANAQFRIAAQKRRSRPKGVPKI